MKGRREETPEADPRAHGWLSLKRWLCFMSPVPQIDTTIHLQWWQQHVGPYWGSSSIQMCWCVHHLKKCFRSTKNPTVLMVRRGKNMKNFLLIHTAKIKMWLMPSLNKDYAGTLQRDECLNSFSLVALQWALMNAADGAQVRVPSLKEIHINKIPLFLIYFYLKTGIGNTFEIQLGH